MSGLETDRIVTGDTFDVLPTLADESIHAVVTDPPYGLAFMGRDWDDFSPSEYQEWCEEWAREVRRVLKPGGHLLAFSGNRTHHRLFTGVEDAGFEIRDTLTWHYGSGFPKASDISKTIDKREGAEREETQTKKWPGRGTHISTDGSNDGYKRPSHSDSDLYETEPATDAAREWDGWKTGLKPATEFIVMARKPYGGTTVDSVLEHGTGALNIDGTRIENDIDEVTTTTRTEKHNQTAYGEADSKPGKTVEVNANTEGRYPANVVFDETAADALDREVGETSDSTGSAMGAATGGVYGGYDTEGYDNPNYNDSGGPSRYFYTSKASKAERTEGGSIDNDHPTVKPLDLAEWLIRLVTREGQVVLDPFAGSGTIPKAAKALNREFVGIEQQPRYADLARVRCGLTPNDPATVRSDDAQRGFEAYTDGGDDAE